MASAPVTLKVGTAYSAPPRVAVAVCGKPPALASKADVAPDVAAAMNTASISSTVSGPACGLSDY